MIEIEIAKKKSKIDKEELENVILDLVKNKRFHKNSLINIPAKKFPELSKFEDLIYSLSINNFTVS
jgi:hypothetical protein